MAPFKLKFRMGSSRSTSQEVDSDPQVNQSLLSHHHHHQNNNNYCNNNLDIGASNSTIDSVDLNGDLISIENNERISLLPNTTIEKLGYTNPIVTHSSTDGISVDRNSPPLLSFEHFIEDNHLENLNLGNRLTISKTEIASSSLIENDDYCCLNGGVVNGELVNIDEDQPPTIINIINTINHQISSQSINDLKCISTPNIILSPSKPNTTQKTATLQSTSGTILTTTAAATTTTTVQSNQILCDVDNQQQQQLQQLDGNRKESIDSTEYLISTMTATPPSSQENLLLNSNDDECTGSCEPLFRASSSLSQSITTTAVSGVGAGTTSSKAYTINQQEHQSIEQNQMEQHELDDNIMMGGENSRLHDDDCDVNSYDDPRSHQYCTGANDQDCPSYIAEMNEIENNKRAAALERNNYDNSPNYVHNNYFSNGDSDDNQWDDLNNQQHINNEQLQHFISNKSSKKIYKAVAKQWGITCKMSDQCRCMDCQSKYFDCEYDQNEHHKTDGGLGAGTPMFISEVMHGTACTIL